MSVAPIIRARFCLCCGDKSPDFSLAILSSFLSKRAFQSAPNLTKLFKCFSCGFKWSERGLSNQEASFLYAGYRDEAYFFQRSSFEPWYSRDINDGIGSEASMPQRRATLLRLLRSCNINPEKFNSIADHGGDRGQMLLSFSATIRKVYEISGAELEDGIERIEDIELESNAFDLVLTCHVLEHLNDPRAGLLEALSLVKDGGLIYLELPCETWIGPMQPNFEAKLLFWLLEHPNLLMIADFICTAFRSRFKFIPPFGFVVIREHLQYFTILSIKKLMISSGIEVLAVEKAGDFLIALGKKVA